MGVRNLWPMLEKAKEVRNVRSLWWKTVAVDLSIWVAASAVVACNSSYFCLRTIFSRILVFRRHQVHLIFVVDGTPSALKEESLRKRRKRSDGSTNAGSWFQKTVADCIRLFEALGIPYIQAQSEAEAMCAVLNQKGLVDACITSDGDALLYGAPIVIRAVDLKNKLVPTFDWYAMDDVQSSLHYTRRHLVAFAGLLGCDYYPGVANVGHTKAQQLVEELPQDVDLIERFEIWKKAKFSQNVPTFDTDCDCCSTCQHSGSEKQHSKLGCPVCGTAKKCKHCGKIEGVVQELARNREDFPPEKVFEEFLHPSESVPELGIPPVKEPSLDKFKAIFVAKMGRNKTSAEAANQLVTLLVSWQLDEMRAEGSREEEALIFPKRIANSRLSDGIQFYEVEWHLPEPFTNCNNVTTVPKTILKTVYGKSFVAELQSSEESEEKLTDDEEAEGIINRKHRMTLRSRVGNSVGRS